MYHAHQQPPTPTLDNRRVASAPDRKLPRFELDYRPDLGALTRIFLTPINLSVRNPIGGIS